MFGKNPGTTAVAVLSLAIAIGPNAALFSVIDHLVLRPSTMGSVDRLYGVSVRSGKGWERTSYLDYLDYRAQAKVPVGILGQERRAGMWSPGGQREMLPIHIVSENYFSLLGVKPLLGRMFDRTRDRQFAGVPAVVISHSLWQRRMASDPDIIGKTMLLDGRGFAIVGVAARGFRGLHTPMPNDVWILFGAQPESAAPRARRDNHRVEMFALLPPGTPPVRAEAELSGIAAALAKAYPEINKGTKVSLSSVDGQRTMLGMLGLIVLSLVGLVLLIACANVAGILLAQGEARRREIAVRLAIGAGRRQLVRQLLVESALISFTGAGAGLLLGQWLADLAAALRPPQFASVHFEAGLDGRVLGYTLLLALATTFVFGLAPALRASRPDLLPALRGDSGCSRTRLISLRGVLVVGQIAVAQFLLLGAGLLLRSYLEAEAIRPGFDANRKLLVAWLVWDGQGKTARIADVAATLRTLPGVRQASFSWNLPLSGQSDATVPVSIPGVAGDPVPVGRNNIGPGFCSVMGTRILRGREFDARDTSTVGLVNETMARQLWGGPDAAMGRFFRVDNADVQVVGVVEDGKYRSLVESPMPYMYLPALPGASYGVLLVETSTDPGAMAPTIRKTLAASAPGLAIVSLSTLRQHLRLALFAWQTGAGLVSLVGLLGIFLGGVGLYGVVSYAVNRRAHEIGVRIALGAQAHDVLGLVLRQALGVVAIGALVGLAAALVGARLVSALFYNVSPADPLAIAGSIAVVGVIALLATHLPARRALRLDPMNVLRQE